MSGLKVQRNQAFPFSTNWAFFLYNFIKLTGWYEILSVYLLLLKHSVIGNRVIYMFLNNQLAVAAMVTSSVQVLTCPCVQAATFN